jgi:tetratricopeptide (TPR) repeat protein
VQSLVDEWTSVIVGAIAAARGEYEEALTASRKYFAESTKAGDEARAAIAISNAAICACRLGRYQESIDWALRLKSGRKALPHCQYVADESGGISHAMLGNREGTLEAVASLTDLIRDTETDYLRRRMRLAAADLLMMVGERRKAVEYATAALSIPLDATADLGVLGTVSRWRALLAETDDATHRAAKDIRLAMRTPLDAIDKVECLAALETIGLSTSEERASLREDLAKLPVATSNQLSRLGLRISSEESGSELPSLGIARELFRPSVVPASIERSITTLGLRTPST